MHKQNKLENKTQANMQIDNWSEETKLTNLSSTHDYLNSRVCNIRRMNKYEKEVNIGNLHVCERGARGLAQIK